MPNKNSPFAWPSLLSLLTPNERELLMAQRLRAGKITLLGAGIVLIDIPVALIANAQNATGSQAIPYILALIFILGIGGTLAWAGGRMGKGATRDAKNLVRKLRPEFFTLEGNYTDEALEYFNSHHSWKPAK